MLFAGKFVSSISRHWFDVWGAMDDGEEENGSTQCSLMRNGSDQEWLDPENGSAGVLVQLREMVEEGLARNLLKIAEVILANVREGHLPSVKLLIELVERLKKLSEVSEEKYESLAKVLWRSLRGVADREQGTGSSEQ